MINQHAFSELKRMMTNADARDREMFDAIIRSVTAVENDNMRLTVELDNAKKELCEAKASAGTCR